MNEDYLRGIEDFQPFLHRQITTNKEVIYEGIYQINENVMDKKYSDRFHVRICIPKNYPNEVPRIYETTNRLEKCEHKYPDGLLCLELEHNLKSFVRNTPTPTIVEFLKKYVTAFFTNFAGYEATGKYPFGEYSHNEEGIWEMYQERFKTNDRNVCFSLLELVANKSYKGHLFCPCGSNKKIKKCHGQNGRLLNMMHGPDYSIYKEGYDLLNKRKSKEVR